MVIMSEEVRPPMLDKELYNEFKKHCIDNDFETGEALEKAVKQFIDKGR